LLFESERTCFCAAAKSDQAGDVAWGDGHMTGTNGHTADFIILGAGVMGASIAFHLAKRRAGRIIVLEKDTVGQGASGRSSALVRMHYSFLPEVQLAVKSLEMFENWKEITGQEGDFRKTGFLRIVLESETERLKANVAMQNKNGAVVELLDRVELRKLEPGWNFDDVELAAYEPGSGYGDGSCVANDFMSAARDLGVEYRRRSPATGFLVHSNQVTGVTTPEGEIHSPVVIAATGYWSKPLFEKAGVSLPIETEFHQVAILRNPSNMKGGSCACIDSITTTYYRSDANDKTLVGDFYGDRGVDPDQYPTRPSDEWLEEIIERTCKRIPKLENAEMMRGVTGVYDMSPDARPLLGEVPGIRGLHVCAGFSGMGFKISPAIGLVMSELLLDGRGKTVDITAFHAGRFAEGTPIRAEYEYQDD
jgi:glycine/D-amino acid oxidase-like deaminating enzyme